MDVELEFRQKLYGIYNENKRVLIPKEEYQRIVSDLLVASSSSKKTANQYYLLRKYEILKCGPNEKLIKKRNDPDDPILYYVCIEEMYEVIKRIHTLTGHGGRDKMVKEAAKKYANITQDSLTLYKSMCAECHRKRKRPTTKGTVVKPIISKDFNSRGQVDLIDMQSMKQREFKWIMVYQDHLTKFCVLRPLTSKRAAEVAYHLLDIFLLLGAPCVLQSDNGSEFTAQIIEQLKELWPDLVIVHGKPRHPQSQGSVERANCDIKDMLVAWLGDHETTDWAIGIKFVQFQKNASHHSGIKCSPFSALFGSDAKIGLTSSSLPHDLLTTLQSEDDLFALTSAQTTETGPTKQDEATTTSHAVTTSQDAAPTSQDAAPTSQDEATTTSHAESTSQDATPTSQDETPSTPDEAHSTQDDSQTSPDTESTSPGEDEIASNKDRILISRKRANEAQLHQAERMVKRSKRVMCPAQIGDNVTVPIPHVDRGRADPRNIIGVVIDVSESNMSTIAVKAGVLNGKYSRNQFDVCATALYSIGDVDTDKCVSLRMAVQYESICGGQGYTRCNCSGAKRCQTNRCSCFKAKLQCNSKCHSSLDCKNK